MTKERYPTTDTLSIAEMQAWLKDELVDTAKAAELRTKQALEFVNAYVEGRITAQEAMDRLVQYDVRWGEALHGATASTGLDDEEILKKMDAVRAEDRRLRRTKAPNEKTGFLR